jgi:hypothetical protein
MSSSDPPARLESYAELLEELKGRIRASQVKAALAVNNQLSCDLREAFPGGSGFSARNLKYMKAFAAAWPDEAIVQQAVAQIPWGHNSACLKTASQSALRPEQRPHGLEIGTKEKDLMLTGVLPFRQGPCH